MSPPSGTTSDKTDKYIPVSKHPEDIPEEETSESNENVDETQTTTNPTSSAPTNTTSALSATNAVANLGGQKEPIDVKSIIDDDTAEIVVPPDGGWGWVVVFASFMCNMIVDGIIFSFGMFLTDIQTDLKATKSQVSLVSSLMAGFYLMAGPFVSALANRYGFRLVAIVGSIVGGIAFILSYFATSVQYLWISYGVIGGKLIKYHCNTNFKRMKL